MTMLRLYKMIQGKIFYKECWQDGDKAVIHRGVVGNEGIIEQIPCSDFEEFSRSFSEKYRKQGYLPLCAEKAHHIIIKYWTQNGEKAQQMKDSIIPLLNEQLGWSGLGYVDGYDISVKRGLRRKTELQIFCVVIDRKIAASAVKETLDSTPFPEYSICFDR